ncbi:hypothetical protein HY085_02930 [Candidatus Gottesmanbacteria bacterium]|nr:hypothetical protein [Candidatus Gottesmanbacteria bacterium]
MRKFNFLLMVLVFILILLGLPRFSKFPENISKARQLIKNISFEPELETYTTDMKAYLRTYFLVKRGQPYYAALAESVVGDATRDNLPEEIWGWKLPFIFYFWSLLPGPPGASVYFGYLVLLCLTLVASYKLASRLIGRWAILSVYLLLPYFFLPLTEITLFQVEWWALSFFILGLAFLIYQKKLSAMVFFLFCIFTRELFLVHLTMLTLVYLLFRRYRDLWIFVIPVIVLIIFYIFYHLPNVYQFESFEPVVSWWRSNIHRGWYLIRPTLSYSSWNYFFYFLHPFRIFLLFAIIGLAYKLSLAKNKLIPSLSLFSFLPFFVFIFFFGIQTKWQDYWGVYYIPLSLIFAPAVLLFTKNVNE